MRAQPLCLFSWKAIWRTKAPQKKILCENLIKVGFSMVSRCCMCCCSGETMNHLLICCSIDFKLWSFIFRMFGVSGFYPKKVFDLLCGWRCCGPNLDIWNLIHLCLMWTIWRERNRRTFEDVECTSSLLQASFISSVYEQSFAYGLTDSNSIHSFIESIHV